MIGIYLREAEQSRQARRYRDAAYFYLRAADEAIDRWRDFYLTEAALLHEQALDAEYLEGLQHSDPRR